MSLQPDRKADIRITWREQNHIGDDQEKPLLFLLGLHCTALDKFGLGSLRSNGPDIPSSDISLPFLSPDLDLGAVLPLLLIIDIMQLQD